MTFVYLTDQLVSEVHRALIDADLVDDTSIRALTSDIPPSFTRALPDGGTPAGRSLLLIRKLNSTRTLESGVKPLPRFLENAIMLSGGETERTAIFRKALAVTEIEIALTSDDVIDLAPGQEKPCEFEVHNRGRAAGSCLSRWSATLPDWPSPSTRTHSRWNPAAVKASAW